ncbi:hypothetical protein [Candidatus Accumulibacter vicinus]|nr:hypothetical protein [Candidatus Accumulibacter vicinus]
MAILQTMMSTITFDTLKFVKRLEAAGGASSQLAEALAEALDRSLATKPDIVRLENRIEPLEMKSESKFSLLPWMIAVLIALAVANFAQQFF